MAITRPGSIIGAISGAVGATIFKHTRAGAVAGQRGRRRNMQTTKQLSARAALQRSILAWKALTDTQRQEWRNAAAAKFFANRLGVPRHISGYQYYLKVTVPIVASGGDPLTSPDDLLPGCHTIIFGPSWDTAGNMDLPLFISAFAPCSNAEERWNVQGVVHPVTEQPPDSAFLNVGTFGPPWVTDISAAWAAALGAPPAAGTGYWVRARHWPTGRQPGPWAYDDSTVSP